MLLPAIAAILDRDLRTLAREVEAYADERDLWRLPPGIPNSGGTLALHLAGNIRHYLGTRLADTGYVRDRPAEFARRGVPRTELLEQIEAARGAVRAAAAAHIRLDADFPEVITGARIETGDYLVHLSSHLAFHLGQLDYHRRLVTGDAKSVRPVRPDELGSARPLADGTAPA